MDENISQSPSMFEQFLRYGLLLTGLLGIGFDIWWFLDAQSNNFHLNGVLVGLTVASILSNVGFCLPKNELFKKYTLFFLIFIRSVTFDQMTKLWVVNHIDYRYGGTLIEGLFSFVHTQNPGAAFGIMEGQMTFFAVFTIIAIL